MKKSYFIILFSLFLFFPKSCLKPELTETDVINSWIWLLMNDVYLWADDVDQNLYPTDENDPEAFFYSILSPEDRFSFIVDDYEGLISMLDNVELSNGISPSFILRRDNVSVIAVVEYVSTNSPAAVAGIKRGDIINRVNGTVMDKENYADLFYSTNAEYGFLSYDNGAFTELDKTISVTADVIEENPVVHHEIIKFADHEIAYIVYTGFSSGPNNKWVDSLDLVLADIKSKGIEDVIMDIRYNPGGSVAVAQHLASSLAPAEVPPNEENVFVKYTWNEEYQAYFEDSEGADSENLIIPFEHYPSQNLDLSTIHFLTASHSASASELIIISLEPYMNVRHVGEYTYGKCYGSIPIPDLEDPPRHTWGMLPLVFKYANADDYTDFINGLKPDIEVEDNLLEAKAFGDLTDPILAAAIKDITGVDPSVKKATSRDLDFVKLGDPRKERKSYLIDENKKTPIRK